MRRLLVLALLVAAGCFRPNISDGGFSCDATQVPACPDGLYCVAGFCRTSPFAGGGNGNGGNGARADLATADDNGDLASSAPADMSYSSSHDLSHPASTDMASGGGGSCAHSLCVTGAMLTSGCDPCVTQICAQDNYCCVTKWSSQCVTEVTSICGRTCP